MNIYEVYTGGCIVVVIARDEEEAHYKLRIMYPGLIKTNNDSIHVIGTTYKSRTSRVVAIQRPKGWKEAEFNVKGTETGRLPGRT